MGAPPKTVLSPLAASPETDGSDDAASCALAMAATSAGCNLVGWGNNEDGQLVPAGPGHSGSNAEVYEESPRAVCNGPRPVRRPWRTARASALPSMFFVCLFS
jgi:hypothetical protein